LGSFAQIYLILENRAKTSSTMIGRVNNNNGDITIIEVLILFCATKMLKSHVNDQEKGAKVEINRAILVYKKYSE
jgi:hypothetical protein